MKKFLSLLIACYSGLSLFAQVGINPANAAPDPSAMLDVSSTERGVLITRMTTVERDAIASPAEGLQIFNTTTKCFEYWAYETWQIMSCAICPSVASPTSGSHLATASSVTWNWNTVSEAIGYKWNTTNNYGTANDLGNSTTYTQTGLSCGIPQTLYVWAYSSCGFSSPVTLTQSTSACPFTCGVSTVTFTYRGSQVTYGTLPGAYNGYCWLDRNLGATQVATSLTDGSAYGHLFQWGRDDDGHQLRNSSTISGTTSSPSPGGSFYLPGSQPYNWYTGSNPDDLWEDSNGLSGGVNNPCPAGFRIPSYTELNNERMSWSPQNEVGGFNQLKLTYNGWRFGTNGTLNFEGTIGEYWTSSVYSGVDISHMQISSGAASMTYNKRASGFGVRCIKE